jgi:hypothetical protein
LDFGKIKTAKNRHINKISQDGVLANLWHSYDIMTTKIEIPDLLDYRAALYASFPYRADAQMELMAWFISDQKHLYK